MTRFLLATDSVHTTATACDYLVERAGPDDAVLALSVVETGDDGRDAGDALNVASARLAVPTVEIRQVSGEPVGSIRTAASEFDADEIVIGTRSGAPGGASGLGSTAAAVLASADRPVVVLPVESQ